MKGLERRREVSTMPMWGVVEAFAHYGAKCSNPQWSWSARSENGKTVVLTLWQDLFRFQPQPAIYDTTGRDLNKWIGRPGNAERLKNLILARDHCNGICRVVIVVAEDVKAEPRRTIQRFPQDNMLLRITEINEATGEFRGLVLDARLEAPHIHDT